MCKIKLRNDNTVLAQGHVCFFLLVTYEQFSWIGNISAFNKTIMTATTLDWKASLNVNHVHACMYIININNNRNYFTDTFITFCILMLCVKLRGFICYIICKDSQNMQMHEATWYILTKCTQFLMQLSNQIERYYNKLDHKLKFYLPAN